MTIDRYGRDIHYLRISLTDRCNLRCQYCMPEGTRFRPVRELMSDDELLRLCRIFAGEGFTKFRLTGGEPTVRPGVVNLVRQMAALPGVRTVTMTTNGLRLAELAAPLAEAGLTRCNISLDTLNPERYHAVTRRGQLADVMRGIEAAERAGLLPIKINCVVMQGINDGDDVIELARLTLDHPWQVRFIEMMPFGEMAGFAMHSIVTEATMRERIEAALGSLHMANDGRLDGEARLFRLAGAAGTLGFISSVSHPFCESCTRARLTADGRLRLCLLSDMEVDLLTPLRAGASEAELAAMIRDAVWQKPWGHRLEEDIIPTGRVMAQIGG